MGCFIFQRCRCKICTNNQNHNSKIYCTMIWDERPLTKSQTFCIHFTHHSLHVGVHYQTFKCINRTKLYIVFDKTMGSFHKVCTYEHPHRDSQLKTVIVCGHTIICNTHHVFYYYTELLLTKSLHYFIHMVQMLHETSPIYISHDTV